MTEKRIFFHYPKTGLEVVKSIHTAMQQLKLNSWLDVENMTPGTDPAQARREAFQSSTYWVLFTEKTISSKTIDKICLDYGETEHRPELLCVVFLKKITTRYEGPGFWHVTAEESAAAIKTYFDLKTWSEAAAGGKRTRITFNPTRVACFQNGVFLGNLAAADLTGLPAVVEAFHWDYNYFCEEITQPGQYERQLQRWAGGWKEKRPQAGGFAYAAQRCRADLEEQRFEEATKTADHIKQTVPNWEMGWFLDAMVALRNREFGQARFFFEVATQVRQDGFLSAYYSAVSLLWDGQWDKGIQELNALTHNRKRMDDLLQTDLSAYPSKDAFLAPFRENPQTATQIKAWQTKVKKIDDTQLNELRLEELTPKELPPPLPLALRSFSIEGFQRIGHLTMERIDAHHPWIFLSGDNGEGKTSLLQAIGLAFFGTGDADVLDRDTKTTILVSLAREKGVAVGEFYYSGKNQSIGWQDNVLGYGPARLQTTSDEHGFRAALEKPIASLLNQKGGLLDVEEWLKRQSLKQGDKTLSKERIADIKATTSLVKKALVQLLPMVTDIKLSGDQVTYLEHDRWITANKLSAGHQAIRAMIGDMIVRLINKQPKRSFQEMEGLVLIDELENHLHVRRQYEFPALLSNIFPKVQFIASTHSPVPLLGAPKNSLVWRMDHDEEGDPTLEEVKLRLDQLHPNNLLSSPVFGFGDFLKRSNMPELRTEDDYERLLEGQDIDNYLAWAEANVRIPPSFMTDEPDDKD